MLQLRMEKQGHQVPPTRPDKKRAKAYDQLEPRTTQTKRALRNVQTTQNNEQLEVSIRVGKVQLRALIDSGAQGNFVSPKIVNRYRIPWKRKTRPYPLNMADGQPTSYRQGMVDMRTEILQVTVEGKTEFMTFDLTDISSHEVILGMPWLRQANPQIDWACGTLSWEVPGRSPVTGGAERPLPANALTKTLIIAPMEKGPEH